MDCLAGGIWAGRGGGVNHIPKQRPVADSADERGGWGVRGEGLFEPIDDAIGEGAEGGGDAEEGGEARGGEVLGGGSGRLEGGGGRSSGPGFDPRKFVAGKLRLPGTPSKLPREEIYRQEPLTTPHSSRTNSRGVTTDRGEVAKTPTSTQALVPA